MAALGQSPRLNANPNDLGAAPGAAPEWRFEPFARLPIHDWYAASRLREAVFVLEQNCPFQDADGVDPECWHLLGFAGSALAAYSRIVPPGAKYTEPSIGRVVTALAHRRQGMGRVLMAESIARTTALFPGQPIRIGAQARLEAFYCDFGFSVASAPYDEDGILHVEMVLIATTT